MNRRGFLLGIGAALAAPAIVRPESLMKLWVPKPTWGPFINANLELWQHLVARVAADLSRETGRSILYQLRNDGIYATTFFDKTSPFTIEIGTNPENPNA